MRNIGIGIGIDSAGGGGIPFKSDLNLRLVGRSGLDMVDDYGNNAKILPSAAYFNGTSYYYRSGVRPGTSDFSGFIEAEFYYDGSNLLYFFSISKITVSTRYFRFFIQADGKLVLAAKEPAASPEIFAIAYRSTNALSIGYHKARITNTGTALQFNVDGVDVAGGYITGSTPRWIGGVSVADANNIAFGALKESNTTTVNTGKIYSVNYNDVNKWVLHGQGLWALDYGVDSYPGAIDIPWVGTPSFVYDVNASQYMLDNGYTIFKKTGQLDEIVPYQSAGVPTPTANRAAYMSTYMRGQDVAGVATKHNLALSVIDLDYSNNGLAVNFDRSNETMFGVAARAGADYDALNPFIWLAKDLANPKTYYSWRNTGHKGKAMSMLNQEDEIIYSLDEVLSYITDKINANAFRVAKYCLIDDYFIKENGVPIYDVNGNMTILTDFITANNFLVSPTIDKFAVFERGVDFSPESVHFRIPYCDITNAGTFIAGSDVRYNSSSDFTKTDHAIKRSINNGVSFGVGNKIIINNGIDPKSRVANPSILVNRNTGRIFVFTTSIDNYTEAGIIGVVFDPPLIWDFFYKYSDDDGLTWSAAISLKSLNSATGSNVLMSGSSTKGLTMSDGTLVMPIYEGHQTDNQTEVGTDFIVMAGFIYSTDNGVTWLKSSLIQAPVSECSVIEYETGKLMLIGRAYINTKYFYTTDDLGQTWVAAKANKTPTLSGTPTQIGTHKLPKTLLVTCPDNESDRSDITLFISKKFRAFIPFLLIDTDVTYGYTCMCSTADKLFLIYEKATYTYWVDLTDYYKYFK